MLFHKTEKHSNKKAIFPNFLLLNGFQVLFLGMRHVSK